jgi:CubicO group peptidase (beta-lactamase class C family)
MKLKAFTTILILFLQSNIIIAQTKVKEINNYVEQLHSLNQFNGNYIVAENKNIICEKSLGFTDFNKQIPLNINSQFPIASISKTFTSTAILQLKQKGKLKLDDFAQKYLPEFPYPTVTIRHLLSNTSGLGQYYSLFDSIMIQFPDKVITNADIIPAFNQYKTPLSFNPGEKWEYNNVNFCIAALIVEKISELSYSSYLQQYIFKPAGMTNSIMPLDRKLPQKNQVERYTFPNLYSLSLENVKNVPEKFKIEGRSNFYGNGGIVSTIIDLFKYDQALYNGTFLGKQELDEAFTATKLNNGKMVTLQLDEKEVTYGLGWFMYTNEENGKIVFHDGSITGLTSILVRNISKKQTVILLENTGTNAVFPASNAILNILNNKPYKMPTENFARLYGSTLVDEGSKKSNIIFEKYLKNPEKYTLTEREMIRLGYELLRKNKKTEANQVFQTTTQLFPKSWNAFDSYGEALLSDGQNEAAIKAYQKSIEINPENENGIKILQKLLNN